MGTSDIRQIQSAARILLICPDCGAGKFRICRHAAGTRAPIIAAATAATTFSIWRGPRRDFGKSFADACKRFYAAFYAMRPRAALDHPDGLRHGFHQRDRIGEGGDAKRAQLCDRRVGAHLAGGGVAGGKPDE